MRKITLSCFLIAALSILSATAQAATADDILGQWYSENEESVVIVTLKDGKYFGKIISLAEPNYEKGDKEAGKPKRDRNNPEKKLRKAPIIGLQVLKNFDFNSKDGTWDSGTIYDPDKGKTYKCVIKYAADKNLEGGARLDVRGYVGIPALGRTTVWTRVPDDKLEEVDEES